MKIEAEQPAIIAANKTPYAIGGSASMKGERMDDKEYLELLAELEKRVQNIPTPAPTIYVTDDELDEMEKNPQWGTDTI